MSTPAVTDSDVGPAPELRREFVGIMFALAVGEVGLQTAALVQAGHPIHYLPAYSHLILALFVIAASWVGWSRTQVPSAKQDVRGLFEWPFVVLLLDTALVVTYFILVRTVDFSDGNHRIDSAASVAFWHVFIFGLYCVWDLVTKVAMYPRPADVGWFKGWQRLDDKKRRDQVRTIMRAIPTAICFVLSIVLWRLFEAVNVGYEHLLSADLALLSMVLLFRALKGAFGLKQSKAARARNRRWTIGLSFTLVMSTVMTVCSIRLPLPSPILEQIRTPTSGDDPSLAPASKTP